MASELWVSRVQGRGAAALATAGRVVELALEDADEIRPGAVFLGRAGRVLEGQGTFVDLGGGVDAFLRGRAEGALLVQVRRAATAAKGPRVGRELRLAGRFLVLRPDGDETILRTAGRGVAAERLALEAEALRARWRRLQLAAAACAAPALIEAEPPFPVGVVRDLPPDVERIVVEESLWRDRIETAFGPVDPELTARVATAHEPRVAEALAAALRPRVELPSGGALVIESTTACVTIDVDSGAGPRSAANHEAAAEIPRQLRLRDLAGTIVVDFIGGESPAVFERVVERLAAGCAAKRCRARVAAIGAGGLVQLRRPRAGRPLHELALSPSGG